jgi:hypothetical protein
MKNQKDEMITNESGKTDENNENSKTANKQLLSPFDLLEDLSVLVSLISDNAKGFLKQPSNERICVLKNRIHFLNMKEAIVQNGVKGILKTHLKYEKKCLKEARKTGKGIYHLLTPDEIFEKMEFKKIPIHGKMIGFGNKIGFILHNLKNSKGDHYFDFETVIIARWICALFVQSNGDPLVVKTMQEYIADGRKMKYSDFEGGLF